MIAYQKRLYYGYILAAALTLLGVAFISWMDAGCVPGNC
jgi:hypothetical protein